MAVAPQHLGSTAATPAAPENGNSITGFAEAVNTVFQSVDKSRVASGILEEYGLQFIDQPGCDTLKITQGRFDAKF